MFKDRCALFCCCRPRNVATCNFPVQLGNCQVSSYSLCTLFFHVQLLATFRALKESLAICAKYSFVKLAVMCSLQHVLLFFIKKKKRIRRCLVKLWVRSICALLVLKKH